jgi:hypothetical protein
LNPIEESFSAGETDNQITFFYCLYQFEVEAWICWNWKHLANSDTPEIYLLEACGTVTAEKGRGWFCHSGYL